MELIETIVLWSLYSYLVWVWFLAVMQLKQVQNLGSLPATIKPLAYFTVYLGLIFDFILNMIVGTILFLDVPREFLFTARVNRHILQYMTWRGKLAAWLCRNLLDPFDNNSHCNKSATQYYF